MARSWKPMKAYLKPTTKLYRVGSSASTSKNKNEQTKDYPPYTVTGVAPGRQPELQNRYGSRRVLIEPPWGF